MSTNAVIFCKNANGTFDGISVHFDGYVDHGVGEQLVDDWTNTEDVRKLCAMKKQIRSFGNSFADLDLFDDDMNPLCRKQIRALKGLTFEQMNNICGQYNYAYLWDIKDERGNYEWRMWRSDWTWKPVIAILESCRPNHVAFCPHH